jgi:arylsulfatase A-like enzyme
VNVPPHLADTPETRADLALYYDAIARMDRGIGKMMAELERRDRRRSTLVVFLSDNGAPFPREKGTWYDSGTRTPLILSWPEVIPAGSVYDRGLVSKLIRTDAYTGLPLCTAADIGASPSFLALRALAKAGRLTAAQQPLFQAPRPRVELYDLADDPWELHNVADDPAYANAVRELAGALQEWIEQSGDFPAAYRVRDDNTDRLSGVQFNTRIPPMRNLDVPPPDRRWGRAGPS